MTTVKKSIYGRMIKRTIQCYLVDECTEYTVAWGNAASSRRAVKAIISQIGIEQAKVRQHFGAFIGDLVREGDGFPNISKAFPLAPIRP